MRMQKTIPALPVQSVKKSCEYYTKRLGFTIRHQEETFAIAVRDEIEIHLWQSCDKSWKWRSVFLVLRPIWTGAESFIAGTASCRIELQGVDELYEEYKKQGALHSPDTVVIEQYWGHREFAAVDNERNLLTFYEVM
ncbi:bleomycin resistance family protein [Panacibacter ginsenosidivorans]|uniref:Bleomycin resistance protein n=1 Tax=Panacibacter ginsenosidivorans TaxID=1813871 RepID=A0A5B8V4N8_9BACT|nr:bleomycin resistance family protein [Panacibacter ginsenosidivorans]QEC66148.1 bleomycin resistance family protein [Panacibacter ginsenosidivorans]